MVPWLDYIVIRSKDCFVLLRRSRLPDWRRAGRFTDYLYGRFTYCVFGRFTYYLFSRFTYCVFGRQ